MSSGDIDRPRVLQNVLPAGPGLARLDGRALGQIHSPPEQRLQLGLEPHEIPSGPRGVRREGHTAKGKENYRKAEAKRMKIQAEPVILTQSQKAT